MRRVEKLAKSRYIDWPAAFAWITGKIATTLQTSTEFMGAETLREQCWYACQLLRDNFVPAVLYSFVGKILSIDKGTIKYHYKRYATLGAELGHTGRPPLVTDEYHERLINGIE
jgi:hypothetical protein